MAYTLKRGLWDHRDGMVTHHMSLPTRIAAAALLIAAATLSQRAHAQHTGAADLSGTWTLDTYLSDSPEQVAAAVRVALGPGPERVAGAVRVGLGLGSINRSPESAADGRSEGRGRGGMYGRQGAPPR